MASRQAPPPPPEAQEPPLPPPADHQPQADAGDGDGGGDGWATFVGYSLAALNSTLEIRRFERGAPFSAAVFAYPYLLLLLYFYFLTRFQGGPRGSPGIRDRLKAPLWPLAALLAVEFAYQLTGAARLTPRALEIAAAAAAIGATYAFLQHKA